ncbi:hypothetical protein BpHYR1_021204 [Brachionus plicatilis]|uniref:TBC1 domain family member 7 n=1 Tax=Brachionus plicatilis TaxID=10195 RepID=A0A3M7T2L3_BRAPC|nr:hypothetical protein BpHYR1_021204 [Brachionus plicatilis]
MENQLVLYDRSKKFLSLFLYLDTKKVDKEKLREHFLENYSIIPQELRLNLWKIALGVSSPFHEQNNTIDKMLKEHYEYMKHIIENILQIEAKNDQDLNYFIYLLDKDRLPIDNYQECLKNSHSFRLIYRQLNDILDDQNVFDSYYLTVEIFERLNCQLDLIKKKFYNCLTNEIINKNLIEQIDVSPFLECGLSGFFQDLKMYHIIWDRLAMEEYEIMILILLSFLESCKKEHLEFLKTIDYSQFGSIHSKFGLDECKILKRAAKYYRSFNQNPQISELIVKYFS